MGAHNLKDLPGYAAIFDRRRFRELQRQAKQMSEMVHASGLSHQLEAIRAASVAHEAILNPPGMKALQEQAAKMSETLGASGIAGQLRAVEAMNKAILGNQSIKEMHRQAAQASQMVKGLYGTAFEEQMRSLRHVNELMSPNILLGLDDSFSRMQEAFRGFQSVAPPLGDVSARLTALADQASAISGFGNAVSRAFFESIPRIDFPAIEELQRGLDRFAAAAEQLGAAGWLFPRELSMPEVVELAEEFEDKDPGELDKWFDEYFAAEGGREFRALRRRLLTSKRLKPWCEALRESLWAFKHGRYRVVVPTVLPILEGLVCETTGAFTEGHVNPSRLWATRAERPADGSVIDALWRATAAFLGRYWGRSDFADPDPGFAHRHRVLHGRRPTMGDRMDALRLLVAVDFVAGASRYVDRIARRLRRRGQSKK